MERAHQIFINRIIQDFDEIGVYVKADEQMFVFHARLVKFRIVLFYGTKGMTYIRFRQPVLKRRLTKHYLNIHISTIPHSLRQEKAPATTNHATNTRRIRPCFPTR
jgi:hypothetical protein